MPHALLLSPDDQAVSAITAVLEEMSVTCERPLDGPSAAKKLTAQSFDLVLVDCENLPAAKLIFDVCRRSQTGTNPVPIAIVDGRAGLPTAFRLGAELILTKPVAKDQARTTIRTAISRVRKEEPARTIHPFEEPPAAVPPAPAATLTNAAAAGAASSPASSESAPVKSTRPPAASMSSTTEEFAPTPVGAKPHSGSAQAKSPATNVPATEMFKPPAKSAPVKASDDPVLADLESEHPTPVFTSYVEPRKRKTSRGLISLLVLVLGGAGLYAAWMYQPGFREVAQPLLNRLIDKIARIGEPKPTAPSPPVPPATTPKVQAQPAEPALTTTEPAGDAATAPAESTNSPATATAVPQPDTEKSAPIVDSRNNVAVNAPAEEELPGEKTAVILSSQGAEKRLLLHPQPVYPTEARKAGIEGEVVLKAVVSAGGAVMGVKLVDGNPALAEAAVRAVKKWHYRPYIRDGKAQPFQTIVLVEFQRP